MAKEVKPLLLIDVDGVLNPLDTTSGRRKGYTRHRMTPSGFEHRPLKVYLNPDHGKQLMALPCDLVWATTWRGEANEWIGPHLGLPKLPFIDFAHPRMWTKADGTYWKTHEVVQYAAGRPFAWIDDEIDTHGTTFDSDFVKDVHPAPALLHRISPRDGLLPRDFAKLAAWAESLQHTTSKKERTVD